MKMLEYIRRRQWQPTPVLLSGKSHGRRSLGGCSPWGRRVRHDWTTSLSRIGEGNGDPLHIAWRIPGTGEPGGLPSMGLHRVRHDWSNLAAAAEYMIHSWIIYVCNTAIWNTFHISVTVRLWKLFVLAK